MLLNSPDLLETLSTRVLNNTTMTQQIVSQIQEQNLLPTSPPDIPSILTAITEDATAQETLSTAVVSDISGNETLKDSLSTAIVGVLSTDSEASQTLSTAVVNTVNNTTALKDSLATAVVDTITKDDTLSATLRTTFFSNVVESNYIANGYIYPYEVAQSRIGTLFLWEPEPVYLSDGLPLTMTVSMGTNVLPGFYFFIKRSSAFQGTSIILKIQNGTDVNTVQQIVLDSPNAGQAEPLHILIYKYEIDAYTWKLF